MDKLPPNLDAALRVIHLNSDTPLDASDIRKLLLASYISTKIQGGWMVNSKGREYLKRHKI